MKLTNGETFNAKEPREKLMAEKMPVNKINAANKLAITMITFFILKLLCLNVCFQKVVDIFLSLSI